MRDSRSSGSCDQGPAKLRAGRVKPRQRGPKNIVVIRVVRGRNKAGVERSSRSRSRRATTFSSSGRSRSRRAEHEGDDANREPAAAVAAAHEELQTRKTARQRPQELGSKASSSPRRTWSRAEEREVEQAAARGGKKAAELADLEIQVEFRANMSPSCAPAQIHPDLGQQLATTGRKPLAEKVDFAKNIIRPAPTCALIKRILDLRDESGTSRGGRGDSSSPADNVQRTFTTWRSRRAGRSVISQHAPTGFTRIKAAQQIIKNMRRTP